MTSNRRADRSTWIDWEVWPELRCSECGQDFRLSERNTRNHLRGLVKRAPVCPECRDLRAVGPPGPEERAWLESLPAERREALLRHASLLCA
jgi:hypothetical protein